MGALLRQAWKRVTARRSVWLATVLAVDAAIAVAGLLIGRRFTLTGMLAAGPLLASARCSGRVTALVAGYALALAVVVDVATGSFGTLLEFYRMAIIIVAGIFAIYVAYTRSRRESMLIRIADVVQRAILRPLPAEIGGIAFACHYQSATREAMIGGDLYDIAVTQFGLRLLIGDVKGKGLEAVGRCAAVLATFRELAFAEPDLIKLAERMDAGLSGELGIEDFVTIILAEFEPGEVRMVNCGHHPPVKVGPGMSSAQWQLMAPKCAVPPLGLHPHPSRQDIPLEPGDRLFFYTDGLVESRDHKGRFFDLDARVAAALMVPGLDAALRGVVTLLLDHAGRSLADDVLLVLGEPVTT
jgi:hypothetical protein